MKSKTAILLAARTLERLEDKVDHLVDDITCEDNEVDDLATEIIRDVAANMREVVEELRELVRAHDNGKVLRDC